MLIKLASLTSEEEDKLREKLRRPEVKGNSALMNFVHPVALGGGILGNTVAGVASERLFGGNALEQLYEHHRVKTGKKILGFIPQKVSTFQKVIPSANFMTSLGKNALRAVGGTIGAGAGALLVSQMRKRKREDESS